MDEVKEGVEVTKSTLSRPKRKLKPPLYSDEIYVFGFTGSKNSHNQAVKVHKDSNQSTVLQQPKERGRFKSSRNSIESQLTGSLNNKNDTMQQITDKRDAHLNDDFTGSLKQTIKKTHVRMKTLETFTSPETDEIDDGTGKKSMTSLKNAGSEKLHMDNVNVSNSSEGQTSFQKVENNEVCVIETVKQHPQGMRPRIIAMPALEVDEMTRETERSSEGRDSILSSAEKCDVVCEKNNEEYNCTRVTEKRNGSCDNGSYNEKHKRKHCQTDDDSVERFVSSEPKQRKFDSSRQEGTPAEDKIGVSDMNMKYQENVPDNSRRQVDDDNIDNDIDLQRVNGGEKLSNEIIEVGERTCSGANVTPVSQKRSRGRPPKYVLTQINSEHTVREIAKHGTETPHQHIAIQKVKTPDSLPYTNSTDKEIADIGGIQTCVPQKRQRGRPRKVVLSHNNGSYESQKLNEVNIERSSNTMHVQELGAEDLVESEITEDANDSRDTIFVSPKRRRGRPPKDVLRKSNSTCADQNVGRSDDAVVNEEDLVPGEGCKEEICADSGTGIVSVLPKRRRGRPPKFLFSKSSSPCPNQNIGRTDDAADMQEDLVPDKRCEEEDGDGTDVAVVLPKRQRGRPPKARPGRPRLSGLTDSNQPSSGIQDGSGRETSSIKCLLCEREMKSLYDIRMHMMTEHSLLWSKDNPRGCDAPQIVIKKIGHIDCQKCKKRFKFAQYYKHHQVWCGREAEQATCEICGHTLKAMWLNQHLTAHRTQEKKLAQLAEQKNKDVETVKEDEDGCDEAEGHSGGQRSRRQAAKNAMKLMSSLHDGTEQEQASCSDGYAGESSDESSDDEDDESDNDGESEDVDEEDKGTLGVKKRAKNNKHKPRCSNADDAYVSHAWMNVCRQGGDLSTQSKLQHLQAFYVDRCQGRAFPDLVPRKVDWQPLMNSEKKKYMPANEKSLNFKFGSEQGMERNAEEHSLQFGQTLLNNGKSYCYTGGPIWAVEWCPLLQGTHQKQILAVVSDVATEEPPDTSIATGGPGLIQIWSTGPLENELSCCADPVFEYGISHDSGYVRGISWCPRSCLDKDVSNEQFLTRLGLLAVGCSDGSVLIYSPAEPSEVVEQRGSLTKRGSVFGVPPAMVLVPNSRRDCGPCLSVAWQNGDAFNYVIAGYGRGTVYLWDVSATSPLLKVDSSTLRPLRCFSYHSMAVVSVCWNPGSPSVFVTVSFDQTMCVWHAEKPDQAVGVIKRTHALQIPRSVCWAGPLNIGFFSTADKYTNLDQAPVCFHGLSRAALSRTSVSAIVQTHTACTWDVSFCPFYDILVTCDAVGRVKVMVKCSRGQDGTSCPYAWDKRKVLVADLYQLKLRTQSLSSSSEGLSAAGCHNNFQSSAQYPHAFGNKNPGGSLSLASEKVQDSSECENDRNSSGMTSLSTKPDSNLVMTPPFDLMKGKNHSETQVINLLESCTLVLASNSDTVSPTHITESFHHAGSKTDTRIHSKADPQVTGPIVGTSSAKNSSVTMFSDGDVVDREGLISSDEAACRDSYSKGYAANRGSDVESSIMCNGHSSSKPGSTSDAQSTETVVDEEMLLYNDCKMTRPELKPFTSRSTEKTEFERFGGSNLHAIHRVELNPNPSCCLWLASGGQSGLLRLDNLSELALPHADSSTRHNKTGSS